jgi:hypothetical protein
MAIYRVWSGGDNTGGANNTNWSQAYTTLAGALAALAADGDVVMMHNGHTEAINTTVTSTLSFALIVVDKDAGEAYAPMTSGGISTTGTSSGGLAAAAGKSLFVAGLRWISASTGNGRSLSFGQLNGANTRLRDCIIGFSGTGLNTLRLGGAGDQQTFVQAENCTFTFAGSGQVVSVAAKARIFRGEFVGAITTAFNQSLADPGGSDLECIGVDLSDVSTLISNNQTSAATARFVGCKLASGYTVLAAQTQPNRSSSEVTLIDCAVGDTHGLYEYHNALGSMVTDRGLFRTASPAAASWRISTSAACSPLAPFETPWIALYHDATAAITPRLEILRDGSATAFTDAQVWGEFMVKATSGNVLPTLGRDRQGLAAFASETAGTAQTTGVGTSSWTGVSGTAWSGRVDSGSALTPAETGDILARVLVAAPSVTVYVDPVIEL